jgi:hypothetical protein
MFNFLRSFHIALQNSCTSLHSHRQCIRVPFPAIFLTFVVGGDFHDSSSNSGEVAP